MLQTPKAIVKRAGGGGSIEVRRTEQGAARLRREFPVRGHERPVDSFDFHPPLAFAAGKLSQGVVGGGGSEGVVKRLAVDCPAHVTATAVRVDIDRHQEICGMVITTRAGRPDNSADVDAGCRAEGAVRL